MSLHYKKFYSAESFACRVYNLYVKIIKHTQASNEQYKFQDDLHKYHDAFNFKDYFMIQIKPKHCVLETNRKL